MVTVAPHGMHGMMECEDAADTMCHTERKIRKRRGSSSREGDLSFQLSSLRRSR